MTTDADITHIISDTVMQVELRSCRKRVCRLELEVDELRRRVAALEVKAQT